MKTAIANLRRLLIVLIAAVGFAAWSISAGATTVDQPIADRIIQRPAAHSFLGYHGTVTTSWISRGVTWPSTGTNWFAFDYFVDSEPNYDFLNVYVDGARQFHLSGAMQGGRQSIAVTGGTHQIMFEYYKDVSVDFGMDTAQVDNVVFINSSSGGVASDNFDSRYFAAPSWSHGGYGGGWVVTQASTDGTIVRPAGHSHLGYPGVSTQSSMSRSVTFPTGSTKNSCSFSYFVDSEQNYDFLNVYLDGASYFSISGHYRKGRIKIPISSAGTHTFKFEYSKDVSVDYGLDIARVDNVICRSNVSGIFETATFDGEPLGRTPGGWSSAGYAGGWVTARTMPPKTFVAAGTLPSDPVVDGVLHSSEYDAQGTDVDMRDYAQPGGANGKITLEESDGSKALFLAISVHAGSPELGDESGSLAIYLDANHPNTLSGLGCGTNNVAPGPEDRYVLINYSSSAGQGSPTLTTTQFKGTCSNSSPWTSALSTEIWTTTTVANETTLPIGHLNFEVKIVLMPVSASTSEPLIDAKLGLAVVHNGTYGSLGLETYPTLDESPPVQNDVSSYETVSFTPSNHYICTTPPCPVNQAEPTDGHIEAIPDDFLRSIH